ncbi:sulfate transporter CysZ [Kineobactrum sediminis]|uniref:Sulfate transporter CysZ n=2 Tax=Kineobactrum sediminis TaxID=1905677 RepID=A0A2N5Y4P8_9GAMM|nr:sulfate transporter CysZ [Kineobactrum sediminis]PLW83376.1 sulfate transporter CysZ [Kineobactrum sediminis]
MKGNVFRGAHCLLRGASLLGHPSLRLFVIVPLLVNILIFASLLGLTINFVDRTISGWMDSIPAWLGFLEWLVWPVLIIVFGLLAGYLFTALALLIASPFNNLLAEKAEELVTGKPVAGLGGFTAALLALPQGLLRELHKLWYYVPMAILVLVLSVIPGINVASPLLWLLLGAWMMSLQFIDYPMDNHQLRFADVRAAAQRHRLSSMGFGGLVALCAGVPVLNFFVVPAAVVGATLLWCEELQQ